jgi:hypothetical protein
VRDVVVAYNSITSLADYKNSMFVKRLDYKEWQKAEETESDVQLRNMLGFGWSKEKIIEEFCNDFNNKPVFSKMIFVNDELCDKIQMALQYAIDAEETDRQAYNSSHSNF